MCTTDTIAKFLKSLMQNFRYSKIIIFLQYDFTKKIMKKFLYIGRGVTFFVD